LIKGVIITAETPDSETKTGRGAKTYKNLVIVESPAKAKTIQKYLGPDYEVVASMGHVRDLPKSTLGIDVAHGFLPQYMLISARRLSFAASRKRPAPSRTSILRRTRTARARRSPGICLSAWLPLTSANRVTFNEITRYGVKQGMAAPRTIDKDLVNAQQGRRILDRIVGYKLSPFLWKNIRGGSNLSAGRVQSVAVRLIVDASGRSRIFRWRSIGPSTPSSMSAASPRLSPPASRAKTARR
jgi:DNA topoisomerase-1